MRTSALALALAVTVIDVAGCGNAEKDRLKQTTRLTYDEQSGKLVEVTVDQNKNGTIDTWTRMDGSLPLASSTDLDEDGTIDRWEYYDDRGRLARLGFSRTGSGRADAWSFAGPDGRIIRTEISSTADEQHIDRWEYFEGGELVRADEDTDGDGRPDKVETYDTGVVKTVTLDEDGDGRPDRRLTYENGALRQIETEPTNSGEYLKAVRVN